MSIVIRELNATNCRTYLVASDGEGLLIDPVRENLETYREALRAGGVKLKYVLETHTHADHLMLADDSKSTLGARIVMHRNCPSPLADEHVQEGDELSIGNTALRILDTPGHTPDSLSLVGPGFVFTGDVLLIGGSGRTDFAGGDPGQSYDSITGKLFGLPDSTVVWPAHDYRGRNSSTIGAERTTNPRIAGKSREEYIETMENLGLALPERIQTVLQVNQSGFSAEEVGGFPLIGDLGGVPQCSAEELENALGSANPPVVIDVREPEEFVGELGHVPGALLVPMDALGSRLPKLAGYVGRPMTVVCRAGARSKTACAMLMKAGFTDVCNLAGGMLAWAEAGYTSHR